MRASGVGAQIAVVVVRQSWRATMNQSRVTEIDFTLFESPSEYS
jgi:hypothetical protein